MNWSVSETVLIDNMGNMSIGMEILLNNKKGILEIKNIVNRKECFEWVGQ